MLWKGGGGGGGGSCVKKSITKSSLIPIFNCGPRFQIWDQNFPLKPYIEFYGNHYSNAEMIQKWIQSFSQGDFLLNPVIFTISRGFAG